MDADLLLDLYELHTQATRSTMNYGDEIGGPHPPKLHADDVELMREHPLPHKNDADKMEELRPTARGLTEDADEE